MLPFGVTIPTTVPQRSEIPEGLMNYPVFKILCILNSWMHEIQCLDLLMFICSQLPSAALTSSHVHSLSHVWLGSNRFILVVLEHRRKLREKKPGLLIDNATPIFLSLLKCIYLFGKDITAMRLAFSIPENRRTPYHKVLHADIVSVLRLLSYCFLHSVTSYKATRYHRTDDQKITFTYYNSG